MRRTCHLFMMPQPSVSFRISRSAENLAETIHALSQRLVSLEQRLSALERRTVSREEADPEQGAHLDKVERLLQDCRTLLEGSGEKKEELSLGGHPAADPLDAVNLLAVTRAPSPDAGESADAEEFPGGSESCEAAA
jgi:hypothetical protein